MQNASTSFQIAVRNLNNKTYHVEISPTETVESIKEKMQQKTGIAVEAQRYVFGGKTLKNEKTAKDYGIYKDCTLTLLSRMEGGKTPPRGRTEPSAQPPAEVQEPNGSTRASFWPR